MPDKKSNEDYLTLFLKTINEYKRIVNTIPVDLQKDLYTSPEDSDIVAVQIRSMLLRKFITRADNVHIGKIIAKAKIVIPKEYDKLHIIQENFTKNYKSTFIQVDANGGQSDLREVFDDVIYGIYLHADFDRAQRLDYSTDLSRHFLMSRLVLVVEESLYQLYNIIKDNKENLLPKSIPLKKAVVIRSKEFKQQNVLSKGFWGNLLAKTLEDDDIAKIITQKNIDELQILRCTMGFLDKLSEGKTDNTDMQNIIYQPTKNDWGDFSKAKEHLISLGEVGFGTTVKYNDKKNVAYVKVLKNVGDGFVVNSPQIISSVEFITLIKDPLLNEWRIFALGGMVNPFEADK